MFLQKSVKIKRGNMLNLQHVVIQGNHIGLAEEEVEVFECF